MNQWFSTTLFLLIVFRIRRIKGLKEDAAAAQASYTKFMKQFLRKQEEMDARSRLLGNRATQVIAFLDALYIIIITYHL